MKNLKSPVDKVFLWLLFLVSSSIIIILLLPDEFLGIPQNYWFAGWLVSVILVVVGWFVVLWFRGRDSANRDFEREATKEDRVGRILFRVVILLCVVLVLGFVIFAVIAPDEIFGIPLGYWLAGSFFSPVLVIVVWVVVVWFRERE